MKTWLPAAARRHALLVCPRRLDRGGGGAGSSGREVVRHPRRLRAAPAGRCRLPVPRAPSPRSRAARSPRRGSERRRSRRAARALRAPSGTYSRKRTRSSTPSSRRVAQLVLVGLGMTGKHHECVVGKQGRARSSSPWFLWGRLAATQSTTRRRPAVASRSSAAGSGLDRSMRPAPCGTTVSSAGSSLNTGRSRRGPRRHGEQARRPAARPGR